MAIEPANVAGRIAGALLGYWLNGKLTFAGDETAIGRAQLLRFVLMWLGTTTVSTWSMGAIDNLAGLRMGVAGEAGRGGGARRGRLRVVAALGVSEISRHAAIAKRTPVLQVAGA